MAEHEIPLESPQVDPGPGIGQETTKTRQHHVVPKVTESYLLHQSQIGRAEDDTTGKAYASKADMSKTKKDDEEDEILLSAPASST